MDLYALSKERARIKWGYDVELSRLSDEYQTVFGVDGVHSSIRKGLMTQGKVKPTFDTCEHGYVYIEIPRQNGETDLDPSLFHIFPSKDKIFSVVLPEPDGRFSASFYIPWTDYNLLKDSGKLSD